MQTATLQAEVPAQLITQMNTLVEQGWFRSTNDLIVDALRRLIVTHRPELMEEFLWRDMEWGLHGRE
jgi:Arc/MetJ-type ribon-helix-helix transcriptional regulator